MAGVDNVSVNPGRRPVGVPREVGRSVEFDPRPRTFAPIVTTVSATLLGIGGAGLGALAGRAGGRALGGGVLGAALGVAAGFGAGYLLRNSHYPMGNEPVRVPARDVPVLPAPTDGAPVGREPATSSDRRSNSGDVRLGTFLLDTHSTGFSFWPSWTQQGISAGGEARVDAAGLENRYGSLADAMGAASRADGQQAVVERVPGSFALVDLATGDDDLRDGNSGADVKLRITSFVADPSDARAIEYGDAWLAPAHVDERRNDFWVRAPISR
jgi:hypothetical protein